MTQDNNEIQESLRLAQEIKAQLKKMPNTEQYIIFSCCIIIAAFIAFTLILEAE